MGLLTLIKILNFKRSDLDKFKRVAESDVSFGQFYVMLFVRVWESLKQIFALTKINNVFVFIHVNRKLKSHFCDKRFFFKRDVEKSFDYSLSLPYVQNTRKLCTFTEIFAIPPEFRTCSRLLKVLNIPSLLVARKLRTFSKKKMYSLIFKATLLK